MNNLATLLGIVKHFFNQPNAQMKTSVVNTLLPFYSRMQETVEALGTKVDRIQRDRERSDEGKKKAWASLATSEATQFAFIGGHRTNTAERVSSLESTNYGFLNMPQESEMKTLIRELRAGELRAPYNKSDNRNKAYLEALERDDIETAQAFINAPGGSWVSDESKRRGAEAYATRHTPKEFQELQDILVVQEHIDMVAEQTRQALTALGGDPVVIAKALKVQN